MISRSENVSIIALNYNNDCKFSCWKRSIDANQKIRISCLLSNRNFFNGIKVDLQRVISFKSFDTECSWTVLEFTMKFFLFLNSISKLNGYIWTMNTLRRDFQLVISGQNHYEQNYLWTRNILLPRIIPSKNRALKFCLLSSSHFGWLKVERSSKLQVIFILQERFLINSTCSHSEHSRTFADPWSLFSIAV